MQKIYPGKERENEWLCSTNLIYKKKKREGEVLKTGLWCIALCLFVMQLVWAKTYRFGCGAYRCEEIMGLEEEVEEGQSALMVVCNYGPG